MRIVVAGLGDVGGRAAAMLAEDGHDVVGIRRSDAPGPTGVRMVRGDLLDASLADRLDPGTDVLVVSVSADERSVEGYRRAYVEGPTTLLDGLVARGATPRVVVTSSTAVYAQLDGSWVDESSPTEPTAGTARVLLESEQALRERGLPMTALRLTGIYGPGRTRLVDQVARGEATVGGDTWWTNRIHAHDAATAVRTLVTDAAAPEVVIGTDDEPVERDEVLRWLAARIGAPPPPADESTTPTRSSKRCRNALLRGLGWTPRYRTFREGYAQVLEGWTPPV